MNLIKSVSISSSNSLNSLKVANPSNPDEKDSQQVSDIANPVKIKVGLSACLAGQEVRYNGGHSQSKFCLEILSEYFRFKTFCPEVSAGFPIPRPTMRLVGDPANPRLTYSDDESAGLTSQLRAAIDPKLASFDQLDGYVLMKNSPSCGYKRVKVYQANGHPHSIRREGIFTEQLQKKYPLLPIEEDGRLNDPLLRENFILRVYAHHNFRHEVLADLSLHSLIQFHSRYKYTLMSHNQVLYRVLGKMLSNQGDQSIEALSTKYFALFMQALAKPASIKNHTNTLLHILGYLKKSVSSQSRISLMSVIHKYRQREIPLITPLTLLSHYIEQHGSEYIKAQRYFNPYPESLGLRNRV
jgi:uncharacterized protein YbgA (DUF1722 family)/uncharacterized protein YbbK (DUF523 family)